MIRSMFSGVAGLRTHQSKMDVIGNNIANVNTFGYKAQRATFKESIYSTNRNATNGGASLGGRNASQIGYGSQIGTIDLLFTTGNFSMTDSPMDAMIDGNGFFLFGPKTLVGEYDETTGEFTINEGIPNEGPDGENGLDRFLYSRVGNFNMDGDQWLVNGEGYHVYGFARTSDEGVVPVEYEDVLTPIRVDRGDPDAPPLGDIKISDNGVVTGIDPDTEQVVVIGRIALANVPNPNGLQKTQGPYYKAIANVGHVQAYAPGEGNTGMIQTNGLEMPNVDLAREFSEMITTQRGFQANTRIITVSDQMLEELVAMKR